MAGALFGYVLLSLTIWAATRLVGPSGLEIGLVWLVMAALMVGFAVWGRGPFVTLPPWGRRDSLALALVLLLVPALFYFPYRNLGAQDAEDAFRCSTSEKPRSCAKHGAASATMRPSRTSVLESMKPPDWTPLVSWLRERSRKLL